ncbi:hypothetical protein GCM10008935_21740 [Alkalibacillus silvisoli]|uniref:Flp pilus assembly protein CpaB n=2 Tax=Alkalibacillus silvisoli TaxID=392823 RepID=A0ABN1A1V2_9BACI
MIFLILAFILALSAGYFVYDKVRALNSELGGMTEVYVANGNIPSRLLIQENNYKVMELPNRFVTDSHITSSEQLHNRVSVVPLEDGDLITKNVLKPQSNLQNDENRLIAIHRTENIHFDQVIDALDRVDIIVSNENDDGDKVTEVFMTDVPVVFAQGSNENFSGIAVEVSFEEAPDLIHAQNYAEHIRIIKANVGVNEQLPEIGEENEHNDPDNLEGDQ